MDRMHSARARILLAIVAGTCLTAPTCWDPILTLRDCPQIQMQIEVGSAGDYVPNCFASEDLETIPGHESFSTPSLPGSLLIASVPRNRFVDRVRLTPTGSAVAGVVETFLIIFDGGSPEFDQTISIEVTFVSNGAPPASPCSPLPIAEGDACGQIRGAAVDWLMRCNAELSQPDAEKFAASICGPGADRFTDPLARYDSGAAGECACEISAMPCSAGDPFRFVPSCIDTLAGSLSDGSSCSQETAYQCASGACTIPQAACGGVCAPIVPVGGGCVDMVTLEALPCSAGAYCDPGSLSCETLPVEGEPCNFFGLCSGDFDAFLFPTIDCDPDTFTCQEPGRQGTPCLTTACMSFYECGGMLTCDLKPATGAGCTTSVDTATPTHADWLFALSQANAACRVDFPTSASGDFCAADATNPSIGTCIDAPVESEICGLGNGLSPRCAEGSYCNGIDAGLLSTGDSGICVPLLGQGALCDPFWDASLLGPQCGEGMNCNLDPVNFVDYKCGC